ncbi:hypothetical protein ON010_g1401 [Phytophthora cinnamomi]|nr:hypothetical protein ON010_g1401 [Phytophthora cinnamomi]
MPVPSLDHEDKAMGATLFSWINKRIRTDQEQRKARSEGHSTLSAPSSRTPNVKITIEVASPRRKRTSRYLCERDRREIIQRIGSGEQQASLAKEFGVSRAAISNLYKNRCHILARGVRDPSATHPKKSHKKKLLSQQTHVAPAITQANVVVPAKASLPKRQLSNATENVYDVRMGFPIGNTPEHDSTEDNSTPWAEDQINLSSQDHHPPHLSWPSQHRNPDLAWGGEEDSCHIHEVSAISSPCRNLVAALRDESMSATAFQQQAKSLLRILVEESLALLPLEGREMTNRWGDVCYMKEMMNGEDICAVSMESRDKVLLQAFSEISPASPVRIVETSIGDSRTGMASLHSRESLRSIRPHQVVLLLDIECATGHEACEILQHLVHERQIAAKSVYFVTVISSLEGIKNVSKRFPGRWPDLQISFSSNTSSATLQNPDVTLITGQVDTVLDQEQRIRPGIGNFMHRYWNVET